MRSIFLFPIFYSIANLPSCNKHYIALAFRLCSSWGNQNLFHSRSFLFPWHCIYCLFVYSFGLVFTSHGKRKISNDIKRTFIRRSFNSSHGSYNNLNYNNKDYDGNVVYSYNTAQNDFLYFIIEKNWKWPSLSVYVWRAWKYFVSPEGYKKLSKCIYMLWMVYLI